MWAIIHLVLFVLAYKMGDIYMATTIIMATSLLEIFYEKFYKKDLQKNVLWTGVLIWAFGSLTLFLHDSYFIMLKPTIIYTLFGLALIISELINKPIIKNMIEKNMEKSDEKITIDPKRSKVFSYAFGGLNFILAVVNFYFATYLGEDLWVDFKIYSTIVLSCTMIGLMIYLVFPQALKKEKEKDKKEKEQEA
jgi:intracellular septation protein